MPYTQPKSCLKLSRPSANCGSLVLNGDLTKYLVVAVTDLTGYCLTAFGCGEENINLRGNFRYITKFHHVQ